MSSLNYIRLYITLTSDIDGIILPKGANIGVAPYFMGRDEKIWKNAGEFIPERFDSPEEKIHPYAHIAFSAGPRNVCKLINDLNFNLKYSFSFASF